MSLICSSIQIGSSINIFTCLVRIHAFIEDFINPRVKLEETQGGSSQDNKCTWTACEEEACLMNNELD